MAKGIAINGQLRGKIGGTVYYRAGGEQISRARNFKPNNPQTQSQMMQRLALANASKASKGLKEIIDHSFEGIRYGVDSVRHFESKAQLALRAATPYVVGVSQFTPLVPMDALGFPVADYLISSGSLASAGVNIQRYDESGAISGFVTNADVPTGVTNQTLTARQFCETMGVNVDSQLTFVLCSAEESIGGAGSETIFNDNLIDVIIRVNFDQAQLDVPMLDGNKVKSSVLVADKSQNVDVLEVALSGTKLGITIDRDNSAAAIIISRYVDGEWRRSTEKLSLAAKNGTGQAAANLEFWGWNWLDDLQATLTKSGKVVEDRLLNKEDNSDIG